MIRAMWMRAAVAGVLLVTACGGGDGEDDESRVKPGARQSKLPAIPKADDAQTVMALADPHPDALAWVTSAGSVQIGQTGPSWSGSLDPKDPIVIGAGQDIRRAVL